QGYWTDSFDVQKIALHAARRLKDRAGEARIQRILSSTAVRLGRHEDARLHSHQALAVYAELGDLVGQGHIHNVLANLELAVEREARPTKALDHARQSLDLFQSAGHRSGEAMALNTVGWLYHLLDEHRTALGYCDQAIAVLEELGDRDGQANTWDSL